MWLHLVRANPVFAALAENPRVLLSVADDWAFIPSSWKAVGDEDPALGIPTTYYGAVQLTGTATVHDERTAPGSVAAILRRQLATFQPDVEVADPGRVPRGEAARRSSGSRIARGAGVGQVQVRRQRRRAAPPGRGGAPAGAGWSRRRRRGRPRGAAAGGLTTGCKTGDGRRRADAPARYSTAAARLASVAAISCFGVLGAVVAHDAGHAWRTTACADRPTTRSPGSRRRSPRTRSASWPPPAARTSRRTRTPCRARRRSTVTVVDQRRTPFLLVPLNTAPRAGAGGALHPLAAGVLGRPLPHPGQVDHQGPDLLGRSGDVPRGGGGVGHGADDSFWLWHRPFPTQVRRPPAGSGRRSLRSSPPWRRSACTASRGWPAPCGCSVASASPKASPATSPRATRS